MAVKTDQREKLLERYTTLDALEEVVRSLVCFAKESEMTGLVTNRPTASVDSCLGWLDSDDVSVISTDADDLTVGALFGMLWPEVEDPLSSEYYAMAMESTRQVADLFGMLAGPIGQEWIVAKAMEAAATNQRMSIRLREAELREAGDA